MADKLEERINIKRISIGKPVFLFYFYGRIEDILSSAPYLFIIPLKGWGINTVKL